MSLTLKLMAAMAMIIPFAPARGTVAVLQDNDVEPEALVDVTPVEQPVIEPPEEERPPLRDEATAVREFVGIMMTEWQGNEFQFAVLANYYVAIAHGMRWPEISVPSFSKHLKRNGCVRIQKDLRKIGKGKPIYYVIPEIPDEVAA